MRPPARRSVLFALAVLVVATGAAAAVVLVAGGDGAKRPARAAAPQPVRPGQLIEQVYGRLIGGQYGRAWDLLHPAHQAIVSRARYIACAADWPPSPDLETFEVLKVFDEPIDVALVPQRLSKAVTYRVTVSAGDQRDTFTSTGHAVDVGGRWRWVLARADIVSFRAGECP